jgi:hypothetical protein
MQARYCEDVGKARVTQGLLVGFRNTAAVPSDERGRNRAGAPGQDGVYVLSDTKAKAIDDTPSATFHK